MVMAALAWNLKAWFALLVPDWERGLELLKMESRTFLAGDRPLALSDRAHGAPDRVEDPELEPLADGPLCDPRATPGVGSRLSRIKRPDASDLGSSDVTRSEKQQKPDKIVNKDRASESERLTHTTTCRNRPLETRTSRVAIEKCS